MASELVIDGVPTNLRVPPELGARFMVDGDTFSICARVREYAAAHGMKLHVIVLPPQHFAICETDRSGRESLIFRVGPGCEIDELDGRVIDKLNHIRTVPADVRLRDLEREIDREKVAREDQQREKMWATMGEPLYANLSRLGFVSTPRAESYRPLNNTARRAGRK